MNTEKAIEFLEKELIESSYFSPAQREKLKNVVSLIKAQQDLITKFSSDCEVYQKDLDQIDIWAMDIQELIKKIRGKI